MALWPLAPVANTVPSGRKTAGPISNPSESWTVVLPALCHSPEEGTSISELLPFLVSTVKTCILGSRVQPSSLLMSALPVPVGVQVKVAGSKIASWLVSLLANINRPSARTTLDASLMQHHPGGGATEVHEFAIGS